MVWFWEIIWWFFLPLILLFDCFNWLINTIFGGAPRIHTWTILQHKWKRIRGITVVKTEMDAENGYLYWKATYSDGSTLFYR